MLFPHLAQVAVERVFLAGRSVRIQASTRGRQTACPACGGLSARVHSRYQRWLSDTAVGGQETVIQLRVRRFFCPDPACKKATFAEQVPGLTVRYGRRSAGLTRTLRAVALALGGRAGARLTGALAAGVSRMTLIRLIRALPDPALARAPRVLGVDLSRSCDYPDCWRGCDGMPWWRAAREGPGAGQVGIMPPAWWR